MSSNFTSVPSEYLVAGVLMTALGVVGVCINITVILALIRTPSFYNAFGYICILHLISNAGELLIFSLWNGPATIWYILTLNRVSVIS
ncbi:unnamed protein product [Cylicocyclus nassatus]|uniref:7TM GPCR serpentine receptor class x (Srx) domain-containing protein n=1 Tax=Cylicocyclus nassatus TaxID=53992 RepID=A0AA36H3R7_CYLNA|nr:unnamed protein product [Cylicocyclus nassatus]